MPSVYELKPRFQALLRPALAALRAAGVTPNQLTLFALAGSAGVGVVLLVLAPGEPRWLWLLPGWLLLRMALNALDGMMAREYQLASRRGAVLNELGDVLSDLALYLPLAVVLPGDPWRVILFAVAGVLAEFAGLLGQALGGERHYHGPMGKSDRALLVGLVGLVQPLYPLPSLALEVAFSLATALALLSMLQRAGAAVRA